MYITYSIWNWAIGQRGVGYVTLFSYAVPVMSGIVWFLVLGETLTPAQLVGAAVVLGGMLAARWGVQRSRLRGMQARAASSSEADAAQAEAPLDPSIVVQEATSLGRAGSNQE